ncbi:Cytochrome P450 3A25 [Araneus ventricosus]|uniref:Cytochrome P450 3A25 n=1 Tax=Araneus ventricosus TaxID=182803 RepID=A0A4Y2FH16_ARAVE|nr:Cytochrome P450 3A25 [Araneus ventricosus]
MLGTELLFGPVFITVLVGITSVLLYWFSTRNFDFWKKRNVPFAKPFPVVGSIMETMRNPMHEVELKRYKELGRIYGHFEGSRPLLSVGEPSLLKNIFVKDFHIFPRGRVFSTSDQIMKYVVSNLQGEDWKRVRSIISPTFSTGKIKRMMGIMKESSQTTVENIKALIRKGEPIHAKRMYGAFTMDVIASSAFSTKIDSHNDPDNEFVKMARKVFSGNINWRFIALLVFPQLQKWLRISFFPADVCNFFRDVTLQIIEERKRTGQTRNDFLQLLMDTAKELQEDGNPEEKEKESDDIAAPYGGVSTDHQVFRNVSKKNMSMNELVAQCVIFFIGGYEGVSSALAFAAYLLALHPDIQERVHEELVEAVKQSNGELTYETLQSVKYLDNVISETLRLYPPAIRAERMAFEDYELGDTGIIIPKGTIVTIPIYAMHRDPEVFPDPEKFDPDRWTAEESQKRDQFAYLPFGAGPRNCVAMRFALIELKVCLAYTILNFKINKSPQTKVPLEFYLGQGVLQPKDVVVAMEERADAPVLK